MKIIEIKSLAIPEVKVITYQRFCDERGYFTETYRKSDFDNIPIFKNWRFIQINESFSRKNTIRGFHFQWNDYQGKLVRCIQGKLIDLALDIRPDSKTFGKILAYEMEQNSAKESGEYIWLPPGFAHGVCFSEDTTIEYLCTSDWSPGNEGCIRPFAEDIDWSLVNSKLQDKYKAILQEKALIATKDREGLNLFDWKNSPQAELFMIANLNNRFPEF